MSTADTKLTKTAYQKENFTKEQLTELALCAKDPKYFLINHCYIQHPTRGRMRFALYDYQEQLVDVYHNNRYREDLTYNEIPLVYILNLH